MFSEHYTGKEEIIFSPNEHFLNQQDGKEDERITDTCFKIQGKEIKKYHLECQSSADSSMLVRFFEYDTQIALDEGEIQGNVLTVTFPHSAVLFLRCSESTPDRLKTRVITPAGKIEYEIQVMKSQEYTLKEIFEKNLLFLIPFYIFTHEKQFENYEKDDIKLKALLEEYEQILYIPISSGLSGSWATAMAMAQDEPYEGRVFVVDHGRVSTPLHRLILDAAELIGEGYSGKDIRDILEASREDMEIYIGVDTLEHLKKGGRITPAAALLGTVLNIKPVLKLDVGMLDSYKKCRGFGKAKKAMIEAMEHDINTRFKEYKDRGELYLLAASSASGQETEQWVKEIEEAFPGMEVMCDNLSLGVSCHTGQGALGIGCCVKPGRRL